MFYFQYVEFGRLKLPNGNVKQVVKYVFGPQGKSQDWK